jgi:predicted ester cyclase
MSMPPTNKHVSMSGASFMRMNDGRVVESWEYFDTGGMLMQLGMMPTDAGDGEGS